MRIFCRAAYVISAVMLIIFSESISAEPGVFSFPLSLEIVEEEAFFNVSSETLIFGKNISRIEKRAFGEIDNLKTVMLSESIEYIDDKAFSFNPDLFFLGVPGSYAEDWAKGHKYFFFPISYIWAGGMLQNRNQVFSSIRIYFNVNHGDDANKVRNHLKKVIRSVFSHRPQDRKELHPIEYRFP